ncbi:hypothetical protein SALBM135S_07048 [Streptomyces alboniger]
MPVGPPRTPCALVSKATKRTKDHQRLSRWAEGRMSSLMSSLRAVLCCHRCPGKDPRNIQGAGPWRRARWCVRHRLVAVLLWLAALGGATTAAAVAGTAYSNDYEVPGTSPATRRTSSTRGSTGSAVTATRSSGTPDPVPTSAPPMSSGPCPTPWTASPHCPPWPRSPVPTETGAPAGSARTAGRLRDGHLPRAGRRHRGGRRPARRRHRQGRRIVRARSELGGTAIGLTESKSAQVAEVVGVAVAAVVLFLAFGSLAASALPSPPPWSPSARRTRGPCCSAMS